MSSNTSIYANGSRGAVVRAAFLPYYPFCWIAFLEDFLDREGDGLDWLREEAEGVSAEDVISSSFVFSDTGHCDLWVSIAFENGLESQESMLRFENTLRAGISFGAINPPPSEKKSTPLGLVSRKIHLPRK